MPVRTQFSLAQQGKAYDTGLHLRKEEISQSGNKVFLCTLNKILPNRYSVQITNKLFDQILQEVFL